MEEPTSQEIEAIQLREEHVQEILATPPNWLVSWGTTVVFGAMALLIAVAWWVQYPDLVNAPIILTTPQPPVQVISPTAGNLTKLLVKENQLVKSGQRLAIIKSLANPEDVFKLEQFLMPLHYLHPDTLLQLQLPKNPQLGELQAIYSDFVQYLENYQLYLEQQTELKQIPFLQQEISYLNELNLGLIQKDSTFQTEIKLAQQNYARQKEALDIGGIVAEKVEQIETQILQYKRQRQDIKLAILNNHIRVNELNNKIANIRQRTEEASKGQYILAKESLKRLKSELQQWLENYVLIAPIKGQIAFYQYWSEQQYILANTEVFTILPEIKEVTGKIFLPVLGSGKVEVGQKVNIKLSAFPYREYGIIEGRVEQISLVSKESTLMVNIKLPNGLKSSYKKELPFRQQMQGSAEIITKNRRLLERFIDSFLTGK